MTAPDPWAVIEAVFPKPKLELAPRPAVTYSTATPDNAYAAAALQREADNVAAAPKGKRQEVLNNAAFSLGQLVAGGVLSEAEVVERLREASRINNHVQDDGHSVVDGTIRHGLTDGANQPRGVPVRPDGDDLSWLPKQATSAPPEAPPAGVNVETGEVEKTPEEMQAEWHARQVAAALRDLRIKDDASRAFKAEQAAAQFREPPSVWTLADELLIPDEPVTYAIDELLPTGANALLAAQFKTGKTTFINNYARAFADGTPFLGRYKVNPAGGRIALYNYELDPSMNRRWLRDMNIQNPDRVVVLNLRGFRLPITAPSVEDWVVRWLNEREVTAWVVDPFARASVGLDENSNSEVGVWLDTLDIIKSRAGVRDLILPTHTGRAEQEAGQERARGATRLDDWADVRWLLTKDDRDNRFFRATGRDVDVPEELLTFTESDRSLSIGGGDRKWVKGREASQAVLDFINANPGCGVKAIELGVAGFGKTAIESARNDLVRRHKVRVEDAPRNGQNHYANEEIA